MPESDPKSEKQTEILYSKELSRRWIRPSKQKDCSKTGKAGPRREAEAKLSFSRAAKA